MQTDSQFSSQDCIPTNSQFSILNFPFSWARGAGEIAIIVRSVLIRDLNDRRPRVRLQRGDALLATRVDADSHAPIALRQSLDHG